MGACCSKKGIGREGLECIEEEDEFYAEEEEEGTCGSGRGGGAKRARVGGSCRSASMFSQQGWKGVNQDAMTVWEDFGGSKDDVFCGVFDGHGPLGHKVSGHVHDALPTKISSRIRSLQSIDGATYSDSSSDSNQDGWFASVKDIFIKSFEELDEELGNSSTIDCICSGTTAVTVVKQKEHLIIANLGDSRAVLGTWDDKNQLVPIQLTVDLKPNLPSEEERIRSCRGRVFALEEEPAVHRLWMPDEDCPGLAMARAFGDFCLKSYGLISTPQVSYRKISEKDDFVVLATDGVWDVLSNKEVIKIVSSASKRSDAAKLLVKRAVRAWRSKHPTSKVDDCAAICLFLRHLPPPAEPIPDDPSKQANSTNHSSFDSFKTAKSEPSDSEEVGVGSKEWTALEGVSRVNSLLKVPRLVSVLSWRRRSVKMEEDEFQF